MLDQPNVAQPPTFPDQSDIPPMPVMDTPPTPTPSPPSSDVPDIPPIITDSSSPKKRSGKLIATILGIFLLIGAVGAGVILVKQNQNIREKAGSGRCPNIAPPRCTGCTPNIDDSTGCIVGYECGESSSCPPPTDPCEGRSCLKIVPPTCDEGCTVDYDIDDCGCATNVTCECPPEPPTHTCPKPNLPPGGLAGLCPGEGCKTITDIDSWGCVSGWRCECPESTPAPTPTPGINAMCSVVKAYDINWNLLTGTQLSALSAGSVVRFTILGTPADQIDKARFTINGVLGSETTNKKPGTNEYYVEYTIPTGVLSFTVTAQIHHLTLGWF